MKHRLFLLLVCLFAFAMPAFGQSTSVGGTVTDTASQTWNNGTIAFRFIPAPNYNGPYSWTGGAFNPATVITGNLNGSGVYSAVSVPSNSAITPVGSKWQVTVCPQATASCFVTSAIISGASQTLNITPDPILVSPGANKSVYATSEVTGAQIGSQIYVIGTGLETYNGSAWSFAGGGGTVTSVTASAPITSSGGATPNIACATCVPNTRTVNGHALSADVTVTASDVGLGNVTNVAQIQKVASGTAALGTGAISSGTCATVVTAAATGTLTTDDIVADFNADPTATTGYVPGAMLTIIKYPTADTVNFKVCNNTVNSITPSAVTLNWRVIR